MSASQNRHEPRPKSERVIRLLLAAGLLFGAVLPLPAQWVNVTGNLADMPSECGNLCLLSVVPDQQLMYDRGVVRSTNEGHAWSQVCGPGVIKGSQIIELPDGKLAAVAGKGVKVSSDRGVSWTPVLEPTPIQPAGVIYAPARQAFFIWHWDCGNKVLTNAVWRHDYRVESRPLR